MADNMLRIAGRSAEGYAKAIKTTEDGELIVASAGNNVELASGTITANETGLFIAPSNTGKAIFITVDNKDEAYSAETKLAFEHKIGEIFFPWFDGYGDKVEIDLYQNGVYGPIQGFPFMDGGVIKITTRGTGTGPYIPEESLNLATLTNLALNKTYIYGDNKRVNDNVENAFDENRATRITFEPATGIESYVGVDFENPVLINILFMWGRNGTGTPNAFTFFGSDDGITWNVLTTGSLKRDDSNQFFPCPENDHAYRYYKIQFNSNYGSNDVAMHDIRLFYVQPVSDSQEFDITVQSIL